MVQQLDAVSRVAYDERAQMVGVLPTVQWAARMRGMPREDRPTYLRARCRWRVDEFAALVMRPVLERIGPVSDANEIDDFIFGLPPRRAGSRATTQRLLMTGRGIGKTTRLKIRALHAMLYGCSKVGAAIAASEDDANGWVSTLGEWLKNPSNALRALFPEVEYVAKERSLWLRTRYGESWLLARTFTGALRGVNIDGRRPDALYLDDVEGEDKSVTKKARDKNQLRITKKVLPLGPLEGGAETWWVQTPVDPDCVAVRAMKGHPELRGWVCRRVPVVRQWPDIDPTGEAVHPLWAENRRIFEDRDAYDSEEEREAAARLHFEAHREEMAAGSIVLDEVRLPIDACYRKKWTVGPTSWRTEFMVDLRASSSSTFEPNKWPRFIRHKSHVRRAGHDISYAQMELSAHYDPSDGGDDGALVIVGRHRGRYYLLCTQVWSTSKLSVQIAGIPDVVRPWVKFGLDTLQWEPTTGSASVVKAQVVKALRDAGVSIDVVDRHSTERKEARIVATLEPKGASGQLVIGEDLSMALESQIEGFDPRARNNEDDLLDAFQRAVERLEQGTDAAPDAGAMLDFLDGI